MITDYDKICAICGRVKQNEHHLIFGRGMRDLADADGLTIPVCLKCHEDIHKDEAGMALSKMLGQMAYESEFMYSHWEADKSYRKAKEEARMAFMQKYGRSWI